MRRQMVQKRNFLSRPQIPLKSRWRDPYRHRTNCSQHAGRLDRLRRPEWPHVSLVLPQVAKDLTMTSALWQTPRHHLRNVRCFRTAFRHGDSRRSSSRPALRGHQARLMRHSKPAAESTLERKRTASTQRRTAVAARAACCCAAPSSSGSAEAAARCMCFCWTKLQPVFTATFSHLIFS